MIRKSWVLGMVLGICLSAPLSATSIDLGKWYTFFWNSDINHTYPQTAYDGSAADKARITGAAPDWNGQGQAGTPIWTLGGPSSWDFTSPVATYVKVTDTLIPGARFQILDGATVLGTTSTPPGFSTGMAKNCLGGNDPVTCMVDSNFSSGTFVLPAGPHTLSINAIQGDYLVEFSDNFPPYGGMAWFGVTAVPEPATVSLMLAGLAVLVTLGRRKRSV